MPPPDLLPAHQQHRGAPLAARDGFDVINCQSCGFAHITPIPTEEELASLYAHEYYSSEKPLYISKHREDREWWEMVYSRRFQVIEANLPSTDRSLLDIGSGPGTFLLEGKKRGWSVKGIDPSSQAAKHCQSAGLDVTNAFYGADTADALGKHEAINLSFVLEHVPDPRAILNLARGNLNERGILSIEVPNDFSPFQTVLRDHLSFDPWWVMPPHHINYFNFESLAKLVDSCGFETIHSEATFPIDMFLLMGDNYVGDDEVGAACHKKRVAFESSLYRSGRASLLTQLYADFAKAGVGREVVLFARKV